MCICWFVTEIKGCVCLRACVIGTDYKNGIREGRHASHIFMFFFHVWCMRLTVHTIKYGPICITHSYVSKACCLLDTFLVSGNKNTKHICNLQFSIYVRDIPFMLCFVFNTMSTVVIECCAL